MRTVRLEISPYRGVICSNWRHRDLLSEDGLHGSIFLYSVLPSNLPILNSPVSRFLFYFVPVSLPPSGRLVTTEPPIDTCFSTHCTQSLDCTTPILCSTTWKLATLLGSKALGWSAPCGPKFNPCSRPDGAGDVTSLATGREDDGASTAMPRRRTDGDAPDDAPLRLGSIPRPICRFPPFNILSVPSYVITTSYVIKPHLVMGLNAKDKALKSGRLFHPRTPQPNNSFPASIKSRVRNRRSFWRRQLPELPNPALEPFRVSC